MRPAQSRRPTARLGPCVALLAALPVWGTSAAASDIKVYTSGAPAAVQQVLLHDFQQTTGHNVILTAAPLGKILKALNNGEPPDVVILPAPIMNKLGKSGEFRPGSRVDLVRVGIGVAVREGAPLPDISSTQAVRAMLLKAKSIGHPDPKGGGFTGAHLDRMFEQLGIAAAVRPKVVHAFAFTGGVENVAKGTVEIGLFNISEIVPIPGVTLVGPLPQELQSYITFAGAVHAGSTAPEAAAAYLRALANPSAAAAWKTGGFELLGGR